MNIDVPKFLSEKGVKPSYQRIKIMEYLILNQTHPTVSDIYYALIGEIPTLSKTTVYNTLNLLIEHHLVQEVLIEENEVRYEFAESVHGHFKCDRCQRLFDVPVSIKTSKIAGLEHYQITQQHIFFKGICAECQAMETNSHNDH